jgi:hypothetical protein
VRVSSFSRLPVCCRRDSAVELTRPREVFAYASHVRIDDIFESQILDRRGAAKTPSFLVRCLNKRMTKYILLVSLFLSFFFLFFFSFSFSFICLA